MLTYYKQITVAPIKKNVRAGNLDLKKKKDKLKKYWKPVFVLKLLSDDVETYPVKFT